MLQKDCSYRCWSSFCRLYHLRYNRETVCHQNNIIVFTFVCRSWPTISMVMNAIGPVTGKKRILWFFCLLFRLAQLSVLDGSVHIIYRVLPVVLVPRCVTRMPFACVTRACPVASWVKEISALAGWYLYLKCPIQWRNACGSAIHVHGKFITSFLDYTQAHSTFRIKIRGFK